VQLSWGACSPQLTTNVFLFIFKRGGEKETHNNNNNESQDKSGDERQRN